MSYIDELAKKAGVVWQPYQLRALFAAGAEAKSATARACLFYKTGAGKSLTSLGMIRMYLHSRALVIAPPATHAAWEEQAARLDIEVTCISHAKFRAPGYKLDRFTPVIADEFHLFGGHKGKGWKKLERLSRGLKAPLILASATPNYNDAERVFCVQALLDPASVAGGYLEFLYRHCETEQNPFGVEPIVKGFLKYPGAVEYLASMERVFYLADDLEYEIHDVPYWHQMPPAYRDYGYNERDHRVVASQIEDRHTTRFQELVDRTGMIRVPTMTTLLEQVELSKTPVLIFCNHSTIADALARSLPLNMNARLVTGKTSKKAKDLAVDEFKAGKVDVLIGTASLATGTDGLDKVSDTLIILDDTDDDSLRRQLIGRIMPRGLDTDASKKKVWRHLPG